MKSLLLLAGFLFCANAASAAPDLNRQEREERLSQYETIGATGNVCLRLKTRQTLGLVSNIAGGLMTLSGSLGVLIFGPTAIITKSVLIGMDIAGAEESVCECKSDATAAEFEWENYDEVLKYRSQVAEGDTPIPPVPRYPIRCVDTGVARIRTDDCLYKAPKDRCAR